MQFVRAEMLREQLMAHPMRRCLLLIVLALLTLRPVPMPSVRAQDDDAPQQAQPIDNAADEPIDKKNRPLAKSLILQSPIDDGTIGQVKNIGLALQNEARQQNRRAVLILEITPGTSQFHHVLALSQFLTSSSLSQVTTVAWVPKSVSGHNAIVALCCNEIVMHPDANLGDIGRGVAIENDEQAIVNNLVAKRTNVLVNPALATAMMDPSAVLLQVTVEPEEGKSEKRLVTEAEARRLREAGMVIRNQDTIKEAGTPGLFSGQQARNRGILAVHTALERTELADVYRLPLEALRETRARGGATSVRLIEFKGVIDPLLESFITRHIDRAIAEGADTIIFLVDSPGGYLKPSLDLAYEIADLSHRDVRTVAYVPRDAISGAAIVSLGCDEIYLHPGGAIGDAGPIEVNEGGAFEFADPKIVSRLRENMRELADMKNRPAAVLMAMVDKDLAVYKVTHKKNGRVWYMTDEELHNSNDEWIKGRAIESSRENLLLTVNGNEAHELKIAEPPVEDFAELKARLGIPPDVMPRLVARTWLDDTITMLNQPVVTGFLLFAGIVLIYLELHLMTGLLGILSALCFGLFFWSNVFGGTAGWLEVMLFVLGIGCVVMEVFVIPGFGVWGVSGGLLMFASLIMASQTFGNFEPGEDFNRATDTMKMLTLSLGAVIVTAVTLSRFLPRMPFFNRLILTPPGMADTGSPDDLRLRPELLGQSRTGALMAMIGQEGVALSMLRPAGRAEIDDRLYDVVSDGVFIPEGTEIRVVEVSENHLIVRQV